MKKEELKRFHSFLIDLRVNAKCFSIYSICKKFLIDEGYNQLESDGIVIKSKKKIETVLENVIAEYESIGLPSPYYVDDYETIRNYNHHLNNSKVDWVEYKKIYSLFELSNPIEFLFLCAASVYSDGAKQVILVDGTNDGGIDLIAISNGETLEPRIIFLQSKKAINGVGKETFIYEDAFFKDQALRTNKHKEYLEMLGVNPKSISNDISYCFCTNIRMTEYSAEYARRKYIKVRVGRNLAASISRKYNFVSLSSWLKKQCFEATPSKLRNKKIAPPSI